MIVAVVGGGQLARMMAPAATELGITLRVLVESPQAAAALAAHEAVVGLPGDAEAIARLLAVPRPDVVTWEHEHIPDAVFAACEAVGVPARPGARALLHARDKIAMRTLMDSLGVPGPAWREVSTAQHVAEFLAGHGGRAVLKTARGGYDGKGVRVITDAADAEDWLAAAREGGSRLLIEQAVDYDREVAALVARRPSGDVDSWPLVESIQRGGVCAEVIAPAPGLTPELAAQAQAIAHRIATALDVTGVLAVEMFQVGQQLLVNELAMRPHNSGHWTMDGAVTGQFEQHLRAVLDLPLGETGPHAPVTVMANVLGGSREVLTTALAGLDDPGVKVHLYDKEVRPGRKVGHVNVSGAEVPGVYERAVRAAAKVAEASADAGEPYPVATGGQGGTA